MEYRHYKMPDGCPVLALLGEKWIQCYGEGIDYLHFHNFLEIGYCYEGRGVLTIGEKNYRFSGNQFSVIPRNCPHTTTSDAGTLSRWEFLYINVEELLCGLYPAGSSEKKKEQMVRRIYGRALFCKTEEFPQIAGKILQVLNIMRESREFCVEEAKGVLLALLAELARENQDIVQNTKLKGKAINVLVANAINYINQYYAQTIRIKDLASACHISETHLRRSFSACMKIGLLEYINLVRIQNACELLGKSDCQVANIAYKCGFSSLSTFNRNFKQMTGFSPLEWRKRPENFEQQILKSDIHLVKGW